MSHDLIRRYGNHNYFEDTFRHIDRSKMQSDFREFHKRATDHGPRDAYEFKRQEYLKLLSQNKMIWHPTNDNCDLYVDISRIYRQDNREYVAFMRIKPGGFRGERKVPVNTSIVFHVLMGSVSMVVKGSPRTMNRGAHIKVEARSVYSIRTLPVDQPSYLIFRLVDEPKLLAIQEADTEILAIDNKPHKDRKKRNEKGLEEGWI